MADDDDDKAKAREEAAEAKRKAEDEHRERLREIDERFATHKADLDRQLSELGAADAKEKAELRQEVEELKEWKQQAVKDAEERERNAATQNTMVVPPGDLQPQQSQGHDDVNEPTPPGTEHATAGGKKGWRRWY